MADVLIYADTFRSADLRHAIPLGVPDPILYAEAGGAKHVFTHSMEAARLRALELFDVHLSEEFGADELVASGMTRKEIRAELAVRQVASVGITHASVPENFPVWGRARRRPGAFRRSPPFQDRGAARRDAPRADRGRGRDGHVSRHAPALGDQR